MIGGQEAHDVELFGRHVDVLIGPVHCARLDAHLEVSDDKYFRMPAGGTSTQQGPQTGDEFLRLERLHQIVVSSCLQALDPAAGRAQIGQNQRRGPDLQCPQPLQGD